MISRRFSTGTGNTDSCAWTTFLHQMTVDSFHKLESKSGPPVAVHWSQRTAITSRGFLRLPATSAQLLIELMQLQPSPCEGFCCGFNTKPCLFSLCLCNLGSRYFINSAIRNRPQLAKAGPQLQPQSREGEGSQRRWWDQHSGRGSLELGGAAHHVILQVPGSCFPVNYFISFEWGKKNCVMFSIYSQDLEIYF